MKLPVSLFYKEQFMVTGISELEAFIRNWSLLLGETTINTISYINLILIKELDKIERKRLLKFRIYFAQLYFHVTREAKGKPWPSNKFKRRDNLQ